MITAAPDLLELVMRMRWLCSELQAGNAFSNATLEIGGARQMSRSVELDPLMCWITTDQSQSLA